MELARLTDAGLDAFRTLLQEARAGAPVDPDALLADAGLFELVPNGGAVTVRDFVNRKDAGKHLYDLLEPLRPTVPSLDHDIRLWAWLSLAWLNTLAPADASGARSVGMDYRWIPKSSDYKTYYRHLLAGPYRIYRAHLDDPDRALAVLAGPVAAPGEVVEQIASHQEFVASKSLMAAATALYYDPSTGSLKTGAAGRNKGSARRLVAVLQQFDRTWDFFERDEAEIIAMLPAEFDRFR